MVELKLQWTGKEMERALVCFLRPGPNIRAQYIRLILKLIQAQISESLVSFSLGADSAGKIRSVLF